MSAYLKIPGFSASDRDSYHRPYVSAVIRILVVIFGAKLCTYIIEDIFCAVRNSVYSIVFCTTFVLTCVKSGSRQFLGI